MGNGKKLRDLLARDGILVVPGAFGPICGIIAEKNGMESLYMSGYGVAAFRCGFPDVGLMAYNESLENARATCNVTNLPVIFDIDNGFGNAVTIQRTVRDFIAAGAAGLQIEDQVWPKRCGHMEGKELISAEEMVQKIKSACDARQDKDVVIIARCDANAVYGFDETIRRLNMYGDAGADILFFEAPTSIEQMEKIPKLLNKPAFINMSEGAKTPILPNKKLEEMGYKVAFWPSIATWSAALAIENMYKILKENDTTEGNFDKLYDFNEFNKLMGLQEIYDLYKKYDYKK